jgi:hypothetical protein
MDGKGRIQVNRKKKAIKYRLIINLINTRLNYYMLISIVKIIKGKIIIIKNKKEIL